jgi:hypothetical protein
MEKKLRMTPDQVVEQAVRAIGWAREYTDDIEFSAEDAGRSEIDFLCRIFEDVIKAGATTINVPDTVGYNVSPSSSPPFIGTLIRACAEFGQGGVVGALSQRSRACRCQLACAVMLVHARSNARSMASASVPATRRWKRS